MPWPDEVEIKPGASIIGEIERGLESCRYLFVVLSRTSTASQWVSEEVRAILHRQIDKNRIEVRMGNSMKTLTVGMTAAKGVSSNGCV